MSAANAHLLEAFVRSSGELFAVTDAAGVITFLEGPVEERFGVTAAALVGSSLFDLLQPSDVERARALWAERLSSAAEGQAQEFWIERPDGEPRCLSLGLSNLLDDPAIGGIVATARDLTEQKHLERARIALSSAHLALVHASSETDLFDELCKVVVDDVTYHLAWVGVADASRPLGVRMVAFADGSASYVEALSSLTGLEVAGGPVAMALETGQLSVVQDIALLEDTPGRRLALDYGYRAVIALPLVFGEDDSGVFAIYSKQASAFSPAALVVLTELAGDLSFGVEALRTRQQRSVFQARFEESFEAAVRAIATAAELRDPYTAGHQRRVSELAGAIAVEMGIAPELTAGIRVAATIHDIGKMAIPAEILSRPGRLSVAEFALVKEHPQAGYDVVAGIEFPWAVPEMVLQHHERLDGSGYPHGLRGEEISIGARIIAVADTVEAINSHRPYRPALGIEVALSTITAGRGSLFDADVVDACRRVFEEGGFVFAL